MIFFRRIDARMKAHKLDFFYNEVEPDSFFQMWSIICDCNKTHECFFSACIPNDCYNLISLLSEHLKWIIQIGGISTFLCKPSENVCLYWCVKWWVGSKNRWVKYFPPNFYQSSDQLVISTLHRGNSAWQLSMFNVKNPSTRQPFIL